MEATPPTQRTDLTKPRGSGARGLLPAALSTVAAAIAGRGAAYEHGGTAVLVLALRMVIYVRVSAPVNRGLTAAASAGHTPADGRALQQRWDSVINHARTACKALP